MEIAAFDLQTTCHELMPPPPPFPPPPTHPRLTGNPNNVLVSDDVGFVAIDFEVCAIRNESMASGYYDKYVTVRICALFVRCLWARRARRETGDAWTLPP